MELPGVAIRHPLHRSFQRSRYCGSAWFMISGSIEGTRNSLKRKYPAREPCWIGFSTGRDQTVSSETYLGGLSSIGEKPIQHGSRAGYLRFNEFLVPSIEPE